MQKAWNSAWRKSVCQAHTHTIVVSVATLSCFVQYLCLQQNGKCYISSRLLRHGIYSFLARKWKARVNVVAIAITLNINDTSSVI